MKNEKFCFNKSVGIIVALVFTLGLFAYGAAQLTQKPTSTSSRAGSICDAGKDMGGGLYRCQANCGLSKGGKCYNYVHNSPDQSCQQCNVVTELVTTIPANPSTETTVSNSLNEVELFAWNQSKMVNVPISNNVLVVNSNDVYQVCMKYSGKKDIKLIRNAYMLPDTNESVFYIGIASSLITKNSNTDKIFGCSSLTVTHAESAVKTVKMKGTIVMGETTPYDLLKSATLTISND